MVPSLAADRRNARDLLELIRRGAHQRQITFFGKHQQQVLLGQQDELATAITAALPYTSAVSEVDARENAAIEAEGVPIVNDEVVEERLQPIRRPSFLGAPSTRSTRDRHTSRTN